MRANAVALNTLVCLHFTPPPPIYLKVSVVRANRFTNYMNAIVRAVKQVAFTVLVQPLDRSETYSPEGKTASITTRFNISS